MLLHGISGVNPNTGSITMCSIYTAHDTVCKLCDTTATQSLGISKHLATHSQPSRSKVVLSKGLLSFIKK